MVQKFLENVKKRDGSLVPFNRDRIEDAVFAAAKAVGGQDRAMAKEITEKTVHRLKMQFGTRAPTVEDIQDAVEKELIEAGHAKTAKAYILYRQQRSNLRDSKAFLGKISGIVDDYVQAIDWRVAENSNASYSLSGLQAHISGAVIAEYALRNIYPDEIAKAHRTADFHIHDLGNGVFSGYSFYRNETVVVREKISGKLFCLALEQLFDLVDSEIIEENGFEIKYTDRFEVLDESGWTGLLRVLRHSTDKALLSVNSENGHNLIVTDDHPFISLKQEKVFFECDGCGSKNIFKNRSNKNGFDHYKCRQCNNTFKKPIESLVDNRKETPARELGLSNYALTPSFSLEEGKKTSLDASDGWFVGFFVAEGYFKANHYIYFDLNSQSAETHKLLDYLSSQAIEFSTALRDRSEGSWTKLDLGTVVMNQLLEGTLVIGIDLNDLSIELRGLFEQIRPYSENKNLPVEFPNYSDEFVGGLVSGVIDGDGVVRTDDKWVSRAVIRVTSKTLLSQIQFWLHSKGIKSSLSTIDSFGEREYNGNIIKSKKQLYALSIYIPEQRANLFSQSIKITQDEFKFSRKETAFKEFAALRKIESIKNDSDFVYDITTVSHTFLSNGLLAHNCAGWSLRQLLEIGFGGVPGRISAKPAKHFNAALGQIVNFMGTLQNEWAGAQAFSSFDTYLAPLVKNDNLGYDRVKQSMQEFIFAINATSRWGNQVPFTNLTMDWVVPDDMKDMPVLLGGKDQDSTYSDYSDEMGLINKAFIEVMLDGDCDNRVFTFPIPTYNVTRDFNWDSENAQKLFEMTAKYGIPYFQNFINSSLKPSDVRSMCCRLQLNVKELMQKTGGLFGSGEKTGSIGVVTMNMPKLGFLARDESDFFERLDNLLYLAKESLEIKRKEVNRNMKNGLLPWSKHYLGTLDHHFSTIGLVGMNEGLVNFMETTIDTNDGKNFALKVLDFFRSRLTAFQDETGHIYNLEATPAEGTSYRLARTDRKNYPGIKVSGKENPYYTNSTHLPVSYSDDIFEVLRHQDELQCKYTGGTVLHGFLGEAMDSGEACARLVKKIAYGFKMPYYTITPTFSICPEHGYIKGRHENCPTEVKEKEVLKNEEMRCTV
jgi:ribonucleoside-triphosphate reductase